MRAVHLPAFGDPTLVPAFIDIPEPAAGQALIELLYAPVSRTYHRSEVAEAIAHTLAGGKPLLDVAEHGADHGLR